MFIPSVTTATGDCRRNKTCGQLCYQLFIYGGQRDDIWSPRSIITRTNGGCRSDSLTILRPRRWGTRVIRPPIRWAEAHASADVGMP